MNGAFEAVALVVPCHNEARRLDIAAFRRFFEVDHGTCIVFVNDGSTDSTRSLLSELSSGLDSRAAVLNLDRNQGKAEAVRLGVKYSLTRWLPRLIGYWDADLATPLETLEPFVRLLTDRNELDMVFGSRVKLLGRHVERRAVRHYLGRVFATTVSVMLKMPIYDTQCGAKLFRVTPEFEHVFADPFLSRWVFDVEILARYLELYSGNTKSLEQAIYEYPLEAWVDVAGSKVRPMDFLTAFIDIARIRLKYKF